MKRLHTPAAAFLGLMVAAAISGCSKAESQQTTPTTQPGSSAEQSRGSQPGAAKADCSNLPSVDDLKKWLRSKQAD
jgi:hypothetical protein